MTNYCGKYLPNSKAKLVEKEIRFVVPGSEEQEVWVLDEGVKGTKLLQLQDNYWGWEVYT